MLAWTILVKIRTNNALPSSAACERPFNTAGSFYPEARPCCRLNYEQKSRTYFAIKVRHVVKRVLWWKHALWRHMCVIASEVLSFLIALSYWCKLVGCLYNHNHYIIDVYTSLLCKNHTYQWEKTVTRCSRIGMHIVLAWHPPSCQGWDELDHRWVK